MDRLAAEAERLEEWSYQHVQRWAGFARAPEQCQLPGLIGPAALVGDVADPVVVMRVGVETQEAKTDAERHHEEHQNVIARGRPRHARSRRATTKL